MYRPSYQQNKDLKFTYGNEYIIRRTLEDYVGLYTINNTGVPMSDPTVTKGKQEVLIKKPLPLKTNADTQRYYQIKRYELQDRQYPSAHIPVVTKEDRHRGFMYRYVAQKKNEPDIIIEISKDDAILVGEDVSVFTPGTIDTFIWRMVKVRWIISGPFDDIIANNRKTLTFLEQTVPGISKFFSDLAEYVQVPVNRPDRIYTDGESVPEQLPDSYQIHTNNTIPLGQACASCMFRFGNNCRKWDAEIRNTHWCRGWQLGNQ